MPPSLHDRALGPARLELPEADLLAALAERLRAAHDASGERIIVGICGAPGAGKSRLADKLAEYLGEQSARVVPFDGFHLATSVLAGTPLLSRRGALETFDLGAFRSIISRLRSRAEDVVYAPSFVRGLEEPIASAIPIPREVPLIVTEGNYLLTEHPVLDDVRRHLDEVWYLDTPHDIRLPQLVARHVAFGKAEEDAAAWALGTDQRNAEQIEATKDASDLIITVSRSGAHSEE
ncbi:nucleoside/nucleotide kinase family protein [Microcella sp.]|uniref:nucleoside/nucleotide kinase family protein n=1 Tax=Microcella sp. TaxID=1913979 RepID=UPI003919A4CF